MKSSVKFDLNGQDESVIRASIIQSDDIRDKVADRFKMALGYDSNLALVRFLGYQEGICNMEIKTFGGEDQSKMIMKELCRSQLITMIKLMVEELFAISTERPFPEADGKMYSDACNDILRRMTEVGWCTTNHPIKAM